jgi:hypothetical protein
MYMNHFPFARTLLIAGSLAGIALAATSSHAQNDPPFGSARVARLQGNVSIQSNGVDGWGQAYPNQPLGPGDRLYTDQQSQGELQAEAVRAYFSPNSDVTLINLSRLGVEVGVAQGSSSIYSDGFPPGQGSVGIQTPNGEVLAAGPAGFRVDVFPDQQSTIITNYPNSGDVVLSGGGGFRLTLSPGQSVQLTGTNPVYAQPLQPAPNDQFASWSGGLESLRFHSVSAQYVSAEMPGYDQLDASGDWQAQSDYGPIWFPHVETGWAPYHFGHWVNTPFFGWTWVADEPWGAAPFHYGRWVIVGGRWGWIPGPREGHPVWSPAQVVFAGGIQAGGVGVSVWFPLGPGEAYKPWYPCSPTYINQINITNIHESRVVHVQTTYVNIVNVTNVTYVNRTVGVTAMRQEDFAAGHSTRAAAVKVDPQQLAHIQPARPEAKPPAQPVILHPIAKPAAVPQQRPVLINSKGQQAVASPGAKPVVVPVKVAPPVPKPIPGHAAIGTPTVGGKPVAAPPKTEATPTKPLPATQTEPSKPAPAAAKTPPAKAAAPAPTKTPGPPAAKTPTEPARTTPPTDKAAAPVTPEAKPVNGKQPPAAKDGKKKDEKKEDKKPE